MDECMHVINVLRTISKCVEKTPLKKMPTRCKDLLLTVLMWDLKDKLRVNIKTKICNDRNITKMRFYQQILTSGISSSCISFVP